MPRKKRIWFTGAKYHITSRGIRRTSLFFDDDDRLEYLRLLKQTKLLHPFILHTYCLMTNHIHLHIETIDHPTGTIMKYLHSQYATYFNHKYHYSGHVFESRYGSELLDSVEYELEVNKYIHLNPLRANMVQDLHSGVRPPPWTNAIIFSVRRTDFGCQQIILSKIGENPPSSRNAKG
ncbi:REP element-mobilizing transposase RayT [Natronobacillus azotifigens]|uniref:Transposase n=1 Tax=Natronobacillus azotifigens TaxID=472978 RepID=A0A9J6RCS6_9BACI|nr:transposase [Natronobacillus azotifigens]MCZ0703017.1 transposase [Natronobacillus azotifigens]